MISDFGFPIALNLTFDSLRFTTYAQYVDVVELKFLPFRKRKLRRMFLYNRSFMIYDGWRSLEQNMVMNALDDHFRISKYACFDERYMDDIKQAWPDYIACYDRDCGDYPDEQSSAEQKLNAVDAIEEREIMHGLTLTADSESERGYCLDISPELFAALYSNGSDNLAKEERLERSLYRATIACISHILDEDGGTCNFDSPALDYKAYGISKESAKEVFKRCGLSSFDWGEKLVIGSYTSGQGNRRTKMAESFALQLAADGIPSDVYYQMD